MVGVLVGVFVGPLGAFVAVGVNVGVAVPKRSQPYGPLQFHCGGDPQAGPE